MSASPVYAWLRNPSMVDFPGRLASVFFVAGCNFSCGFCHNAELMGAPRPGVSWEKLGTVCRRFTDDWVTAAVITGGEPTLASSLPELIRFLKGFGLKVKLDTNGSCPEMLAECLPLIDYVAMDIKTGPEGYYELTGLHDTNALRASIALIKQAASDYEFRTTLIEGVHDEHQMLTVSALMAGAKRYVIQPFVPSDVLPDSRFRTIPRTSYRMLTEIAASFKNVVGEVIVRGV